LRRGNKESRLRKEQKGCRQKMEEEEAEKGDQGARGAGGSEENIKIF
jgi:hypothetical protein